ncbi:hybrid sensor histidine kinase/response regulator [Sodalinema gerasimenkoae]|uniref:hybrid sensor histidine kinase/response regulator n=1 Tax=Sodalinema gerasimenkoae TaxID=2862348 RepID=UPI00135C9C4F|nr:response regulator [Sodalinema gerasimenkoae]
MNYSLDPSVLAAIAEEARQCFLEEDAPVYLEALQQGLQQLTAGQSPDYQALMRAAHSVKGGAGVAQMPGLSRLAHPLEDLLEAWNEGKIQGEQQETALHLLQEGLETLTDLLESAQAQGMDLEPDATLLTALREFQAQLQETEPEARSTPSEGLSPGKRRLIQQALTVDLETCLQTLETHLKEEQPNLPEAIALFLDECLLLGEAYGLDWLVTIIDEASPQLEKGGEGVHQDSSLQGLAQQLLTSVRSQREAYLAHLNSDDVLGKSQGGSSPSAPVTPDSSTAAAAETTARAGRGELSSVPTAPSLRQQQLRIPLERMELMGSLVGELIVSHERLTLQQRQLRQASQTLRRIVQQVKPVRDDVQTLYDRLSTLDHSPDPEAASEEPGEFDLLELDRYTTLHSSLQTFEELIAQVQETRLDIDIVSRELAQDLGQVRRDLDHLYDEVTTSRLVPFKIFAERFIPQLERLNRRCQKASRLEISGENVLVDRILLEQLQTPLTHLLNNALDHGIEAPEERRLLGKPDLAQIHLGARTEGSEVVITIADDGRGINLESVYRKAVERGVLEAGVSMSRLPRGTLLNLIFEPSFSTADAVSDISGRGVGMDVVRTQVQQLRGTVEVDTIPSKGTTFTVRLPLSLNLLSVLLCQIGQQLVAIPSDTVLDVLPYDDAVGVGQLLTAPERLTPGLARTKPLERPPETVEQSMTWRGQVLSLVPLWDLLPYPNMGTVSHRPRVVLVLRGAAEPLAVAIDRIADERPLILKPFDDTVAIPPYLAGCAILGTGEAVPTILPRFLKETFVTPQTGAESPSGGSSRGGEVPTILIAEDSTGARRSLERILSSAGFAVVPCRDGQEAWKKLEQRQGQVDLLVTDIEMPILNGFDLLARIRAHGSWYGLPTIVLTSRTGDRHRQKAQSLGANSYLGKPVAPAELLATIEQLLMVDRT